MATNPTTRGSFTLGRPWQGLDPFIFASRHVDAYPRGNSNLGPAVDISDRDLGMDMRHPSGWSMYHGRKVPGFPAHPHRGFETITIVRKGFVDHADSTGASARYGPGDVQWVTAGDGVSHSEMFPLLDEVEDNPFEIYQIWINLPAASKTAPPEFVMLWNEDIPVRTVTGPKGGEARISVIAGAFDGTNSPKPPVNSWAANPEADVAVWLIELDPNAEVTLDGPAAAGARRVSYVHGDDAEVTIDGEVLRDGGGYAHADDDLIVLSTGDVGATVLVLQGVPIDEPVAQRGPFVMNTEAELDQAYMDYRRTQFGGWPWPTESPVHPASAGRFASYPDGRTERPGQRSAEATTTA